MSASDERIAILEGKVASLLTRMASAEGGVRRLERADSIDDDRHASLIRDVQNLQSGGIRSAVLERPYLTEEVIWVRPGGDDANDGRTVETAVATLERALELIPSVFEDKRYVVDLTGVTDATLGVSSLAAKVSSIGTWNNVDDSFVAYYDPSIAAFQGDFSRGAITFRAAFTDLATNLTITNTSVDPVTGMYTITTNGNFTLDQFKGKQMLGADSSFYELGVIQSNTAGPNSVFTTAASYPFTGPVRIVDYSASITLGDATGQANAPNSTALMCDTYFIGIKLLRAPDPAGFLNGAIAIKSGCAINFSQCEVQGATFSGGGSGVFDACYINGSTEVDNAYLSAFNFGIYLRGCYVRNVSDGTHGDGSGQTIYQSTYFESCGPWGHGGTSQPHHSYSIDNCEFITPDSYAIRYRGSYHCRVKDTKINGGTYGIFTEYEGSLQVDNVQGTVTTAGIYLADGVQLQLFNMTDATGVRTAGNLMIRLGSTSEYLGYTAAGASPFYGNITYKGRVNGVLILTGAADPTAGAGVAATRPALYVRTGTDQLWLKTGAGDTAWTLIS